MHDTAASRPEYATPRKENAGTAAALSEGYSQKAPVSPPSSAKRGWIARLMGLFTGLFSRKKQKTFKAAPVAESLAADRAAAAIAARMEPPMAFKGDTANNTLVIPVGAYAGKPVEQAIRKRAEQQFKNMDTTTATMN